MVGIRGLPPAWSWRKATANPTLGGREYGKAAPEVGAEPTPPPLFTSMKKQGREKEGVGERHNAADIMIM